MTQITILLVEDDPDIQDAMRDVLSEEGFAVASADHGQAALDWLRAHPRPGAILLDLMMPVMDGWTFREQQMADPALASIPVVVISADRSARTKATAMQVKACLTKPVNLAELLQTLESVLP